MRLIWQYKNYGECHDNILKFLLSLARKVMKEGFKIKISIRF